MWSSAGFIAIIFFGVDNASRNKSLFLLKQEERRFQFAEKIKYSYSSQFQKSEIWGFTGLKVIKLR